jgi:hypothetical protein
MTDRAPTIDRTRKGRIIFCSIVLGCVFATLPIAIMNLSIESDLMDIVKPGAGALMIPGILVGMILATRGRVHDINLWIVLPANALFYGWLAHVALSAWSKKRVRT